MYFLRFSNSAVCRQSLWTDRTRAIVHLFKVDFLQSRNRFRWSVTACNRYCFCSSSYVIRLLYSVAWATSRSAQSFTTFSLLTIVRLCTKLSSVSHWSGSLCRKSEFKCQYIKKTSASRRCEIFQFSAHDIFLVNNSSFRCFIIIIIIVLFF